VLNSQGAGYTSNVIAALEFATANRAALRIDVINLSLGHPILESAATDPLVLAVGRAVDAGIVVVVSAGNHGINPVTGEIGYAGITSPGNAPGASTTKCRRSARVVRRGTTALSSPT
jgi:serine protease AprX